MLPIGCITASALHSLAASINRLESWHKSHGGPKAEIPCLRVIEYDPIQERPIAKVFSGHIHWELVLDRGEWRFLGDALK